MTNGKDSQNGPSTSSKKLETGGFPPSGLELEKVYALETACEILRLSQKCMLEIRRKYINRGVLRMGNSYVCIGRELLNILVAESEVHE